jgi:hypothetical protein
MGLCEWKSWPRFFAAECHHDRKSSVGCRSRRSRKGPPPLLCMAIMGQAEALTKPQNTPNVWSNNVVLRRSGEVQESFQQSACQPKLLGVDGTKTSQTFQKGKAEKWRKAQTLHNCNIVIFSTKCDYVASFPRTGLLDAWNVATAPHPSHRSCCTI